MILMCLFETPFRQKHDNYRLPCCMCLIVQPDNSQLHATLGSLLAAIDRYDSSIKAFESAISVAKAQKDEVTIGLYFSASCTNAEAKL